MFQHNVLAETELSLPCRWPITASALEPPIIRKARRRGPSRGHIEMAFHAHLWSHDKQSRLPVWYSRLIHGTARILWLLRAQGLARAGHYRPGAESPVRDLRRPQIGESAQLGICIACTLFLCFTDPIATIETPVFRPVGTHRTKCLTSPLMACPSSPAET